MMRDLLILCLIVATSYPLLSQTETIERIRGECCSMVGDSGIKEFSGHSEIRTLADFVYFTQKIPLNNPRFITDRSDLTPFTTLYRDTNEYIARLISDTLRITIEVTSRVETTDSLDLDYLIYEGDTMVTEIEGMDLIGWSDWKKTLKRVNAVQISVDSEDFIIPDTAFVDLRDPNFHRTFGPLVPIKAYSTPDNDYFFIYIFGDTNLTLEDKSHPLATTYIAKLIFDHNGYIGRILVKPEDLIMFTIDCDNFIGF